MNKLLLALSLLSSSLAFADASSPAATPVVTCESKAVGKDGKPLAGAARTSFLKKCHADESPIAVDDGCNAKAVGKDGKPLAGAAKTSFLKKCHADAAATPAPAAK
jgi:hypothetical protein